MNKQDIDNAFPIRDNDGNPSYRTGQYETIKSILDAYDNGKKFVILEGPPGTGKSAIAITVARLKGRSFYLTSTKILQDQLVNDYDASELASLKGQNAYICNLNDRLDSLPIGDGAINILRRHCVSGQRVDEAPCRNPDSIYVSKHCFPITQSQVFNVPKEGILNILPDGHVHSACFYYEQLGKTIAAPVATLNYQSFLYNRGQFDSRDLMVIDEAHGIEDAVINFMTASVYESEFDDPDFFVPTHTGINASKQYYKWASDADLLGLLTEARDAAKVSGKIKKFYDIEHKIAVITKYLDDCGKGNFTNWVCETVQDRGIPVFKCLPLMGSMVANKLLFSAADNFLIMSATILDVNLVCRSLGIDRSLVFAKQLPNPFPVANRLIHKSYVDAITNANGGIDRWGGGLIKAVDQIAAKHAGQRGIIHTHNFKISQLLRNGCSPATRVRMLFQNDFGDDKLAMLKHHTERTDTILVAPAMHEGVDLFGDLSRFQVLCKVPYPNQFDNLRLALRMEVDRPYYDWLTLIKLLQSVGRSVRSNDDWASTYVLDSCLDRLVNGRMMPKWFTESLV